MSWIDVQQLFCKMILHKLNKWILCNKQWRKPSPAYLGKCESKIFRTRFPLLYAFHLNIFKIFQPTFWLNSVFKTGYKYKMKGVSQKKQNWIHICNLHELFWFDNWKYFFDKNKVKNSRIIIKAFTQKIVKNK